MLLKLLSVSFCFFSHWRSSLSYCCQEGHQQSLGAITGGADTFLSKNKARSMDAFLARWTKFIAIGFFVLVLVINIIMYFTK